MELNDSACLEHVIHEMPGIRKALMNSEKISSSVEMPNDVILSLSIISNKYNAPLNALLSSIAMVLMAKYFMNNHVVAAFPSMQNEKEYALIRSEFQMKKPLPLGLMR